MTDTFAAALADDQSLALLSGAERSRFAGYLEYVEFAAGTEILREGTRAADMYFVMSGTARLHRGGMEVKTLGRGSHFGELGLLALRPRAGTIVAITELTAARLSRAAYDRLAVEEPQLAIRFLHSLIHHIRETVTDLTDSVSYLLSARSLPRRAEIEVTLDGKTRTVPTGTPLWALLPSEVDGAVVVAGLIDRKPVSLDAPVTADVHIAPLATSHWEGDRIRRRSLGLELLEAGRRVAPEVDLAIGPSLGGAYPILADAPVTTLPELAAKLELEMIRLVEADVPIGHEYWTVEEATHHFETHGWGDAAKLLRTWRDGMVPLVTMGKVHALAMGPMVPRTGRLGPFRLAVEEDKLVLIVNEGEPRLAHKQSAEAVTEEHRRWLTSLGITSVGAFDQACVRGEVSQLIRVSEGFQEKRIGVIADQIAQQRDRIRVICIAGPSSSGKTTFIKRLSVQLQVNGIQPIGISLDDYYVDRDRTPRDEKGEFDFEAFEALDSALLSEELSQVLAGRTVKLARFDFKAGKSLPDGGAEITLRPDQILLLEGIHGLNPELLGNKIDASKIFRIFVCPLTSLPVDRLSRVPVSDLRLLRRIVRDRHTRGSDAAQTIARWPSVRRGERKHIFPFLDRADAVFDTSLIYEPAVLKVYAERYLLEVPQNHPSYVTSYRLLRMLAHFVSIYPDHVPPTSILREFIGGSGFEY